LNPFSGGLLIDEMKLTEGLKYDKAKMKIDGFVDLGQHTSPNDREKIGDHALVLLFQPFKGQWIQTVAAFLTKGAANGKDLFMIILDAISRLEQCGLFIDTIISDGASWNRAMWAEFGMLRQDGERELDEGEEDILAGLETEEVYELFPSSSPSSSKSRKSSTKKPQSTKAGREEHRSKFVSCEHPCDQSRRLWFVSDFPHLVKAMKQRVLNGQDLMVRKSQNCRVPCLKRQ